MYCVLIFVGCTAFSESFAEKTALPLWEIGLGAITLGTPDYPGSDEYRRLSLPLPLARYRGRLVRSGRGGIQGIFFQSETLRLNISFGGNLPTDSDNQARQGMPNLQPLLELGPALEYTFWRRPQFDSQLILPSRMALSIGGSSVLAYQGYIISPQLRLTQRFKLAQQPFRLRLSARLLFAYDGVNEYFYEVDQQYASADRSQYQAREGYMGRDFSLSISNQWQKNLTSFAVIRYDDLNGAVNQRSPLFKQAKSISFLMGIAYTFYKSKTASTVFEDDE